MTEAAAKIEKKLGKLKRQEGLTVLELLELVPDDNYAEAWLCWARWGEKVRCVDCGSENIGVSGHRQMSFAPLLFKASALFQTS